MRSPSDLGVRPAHPRRRVFIAVGILVVLVALFSLRSLAVLWTDELWFHGQGYGEVFSTLLQIKLGLVLTFGVFLFLLLFGNLLVVDRLGGRDLGFEPEDEFVRRFQELIRPYARRVYALIALIVGGIAGLAAMSEWQNYILFANAQSFHKVDPLFHKNDGFYVFRLPFLSFCVNWLLAVLVVVIVIVTLFHYLSGGIKPQRTSGRVAPVVKVHLSVLLALVALTKAVGYLIAKWQLVVSASGFTNGAGYADVHARIPALTILFFLSLAAAAIALANIRMKGWSLPALSIGLWLFVAIVIGYIYPAALQAFKVTPAQKTLELPYIQRNIDATRAAYGLDRITLHSFDATNTVTKAQVRAATATINNIRLWDPAPSIALETTIRRQSIKSYYTFASMSVDRYMLNNKVTPVLIGVRQINTNNLPSKTWINEHLVYTHGIGVAILAANQVNSSTGLPNYVAGNVPPTTSDGLPVLLQPRIYFGINQSGWVVVDTKVKELDYEVASGPKAGSLVESHYHGGGGVPVGGLVRRIAFAMRFGDLNFLLSNQITSSSRVIFVRNVVSMAQQAAPFISWSNTPYPVIAGGHVDFVLDGFTSTSEYPYSQNADTLTNPPTGGLPSDLNYVRNSVKLVVNAYTGKMTMYAFDPTDPILEAYRAAFPGLFKPMSDMPGAIRSHLKYPTQLFALQAAMEGHYHITSAAPFYEASDQWEITPTFGVGSPKKNLSRTSTRNSEGFVVSSHLTAMTPTYQVMALPDSTRQQLVLSTIFTPAANASQVQSLSAFLTVTSDPDDYGKMNLYVTPPGTAPYGPVQADSAILEDPNVSQKNTLLNANGSRVILGNNLMIPIGQTALYIRPFYVTTKQNPLPQLQYVIAVFNTRVAIAQTAAAAVSEALGTAVSTTTSTTHNASYYLALASTAYQNAQVALKDGSLATYQKDISAMAADLAAAQSALHHTK